MSREDWAAYFRVDKAHVDQNGTMFASASNESGSLYAVVVTPVVDAAEGDAATMSATGRSEFIVSVLTPVRSAYGMQGRGSGIMASEYVREKFLPRAPWDHVDVIGLTQLLGALLDRPVIVPNDQGKAEVREIRRHEVLAAVIDPVIPRGRLSLVPPPSGGGDAP